MQKTLETALIRELLDYCPDTGELTWRKHRNSQAVSGQIAGHTDKVSGYSVIGINYKVFQAHRVAWAMYYGEWPREDIDHINHNRLDNRIENLRCVNDSINLRNKSKSKANTSGQTGVYRTAVGNWIARICVNHKQVNLGTFSDVAEAIAARKDAEKFYQFHPNHGL